MSHFTAFALPALADPPEGRGWHKHQEESDDQDRDHGRDDDHGRPRFSREERDTIDAYFRAHPEARDELPPGLAKLFTKPEVRRSGVVAIMGTVDVAAIRARVT